MQSLVDRISPILHGHDRQVQGAVLANLLATWLAAHRVRGDRLQTILLRGRVFQDHMKIIRDLTKLNAMRMELEDIQAECDLNQGDNESAPRAGLSNPSARQ